MRLIFFPGFVHGTQFNIVRLGSHWAAPNCRVGVWYKKLCAIIMSGIVPDTRYRQSHFHKARNFSWQAEQLVSQHWDGWH